MPVIQHKDRTLTLVFTDLVGSTALKAEMGDRGVDALLSRHRALVEQLATNADGRVVNWMGDGCLLTFETPSAATTFALSLQLAHRGDSELPPVRAGVHMGEVTETAIAEDGVDVHGLAVDVAARICALAMPGQVLMSSPVFDSARQRLRGTDLGAEVSWRAHGAYEVKGVDHLVGICEAGIEGISPLTPPEGGDKAHRAVTPGEEETLGWRPAVGLVVPRRENWVLDQQLGEGGFGEVWLATHGKTKAKRVFKFCFEPERVRGLKREVVLFRLLKESLGDRPDIAQILDWDFENAPFFIESEYTEGGDLVAWAESRGGLENVPLETRIDLVAQTAGALAAAHSVGVLHKDIKPSNVLISGRDGSEPRVCLTDFGIGLITDRQALDRKGITAAGLTETLMSPSTPSTGAGTRMYMAPELIEGKPATTLSDVYALGVLLYQAVVGDFRHALAPGWERDIDDPLLAEDIAACVDGNPEHRLPGASELATRLRTLDARRATREAEAKTRRALERARRRRRQFIAATAAGIALTLIVGAFALRENQRAEQQALLAQQERQAHAEADQARTAETAFRLRAEYGEYRAQMQLAQHALTASDVSLAQDLLDSAKSELRGWEWGYFAQSAFPAERPLAEYSQQAGLSAYEHWRGSSPRVVARLTGPTGHAYLAYNADGKKMAVRTFRGELFVWDTQTANLAKPVKIPSGLSAHAAFSTLDDYLVLTAGHDVHVYDSNTLDLVRSFAASERELWDFLRLSPNGDLVLVQDLGSILSAWNWQSGQHAWSRTLPFPEVGYIDAVFGFLPNPDHFVFAPTPGTLAFVSLETGELVEERELSIPDGFVPVEIAAEHGRIAYYNSRENLYLFVEFPSGLPLSPPIPSDSDERFHSIRSSSDGTLVAIRDESGQVRLVGFASPESLTVDDLPVLEEIGPPANLLPVTFSPDGATIAVQQRDNTIAVYAPDKSSSSPLIERYQHGDGVAAARFLGSDDSLATASFDGTLRVWNLTSGSIEREMKPHRDAIMGLSVSPDSLRCLTVSYDGTCAVTDLKVGNRLASWPAGLDRHDFGGPRGPIIRAMLPIVGREYFSPDGERMILPGGGGRSFLVDARTLHSTHLLESDSGFVRYGFSSDSRLLYENAAGGSTTLRLRDARTGTLLHVLEADSQISGIAFSPYGRTIASGCADSRTVVWDTATGARTWDKSAHGSIVASVDFDASGTRLATSSLDGTVVIWNAATGELIARCTGHTGYVTGAWFNPSGNRLLSISFDRTARIWDLQGNEMAVIEVGEDILNAEWSPSGNRIAVTTIQGSVFIYDSVPSAELEAAAPGAPLRDQIKAWRAARVQ